MKNIVPTIATLRTQAEEQNARYPQYAGHWDGPAWVMVRFNRRFTTKLGVAFEKGDYALAHLSETPWWTVYSFRNHIDTSVKRTAFKVPSLIGL